MFINVPQSLSGDVIPEGEVSKETWCENAKFEDIGTTGSHFSKFDAASARATQC